MEPVTLIMPTLATAERAPYLRRAINSILTQNAVNAIPLVVANGPQTDPAILRWLKNNRKIRLHRQDNASMPEALYAGWQSVDTRFFGELDDDDELLPDAIEVRLKTLNQHTDVDVVVTNGIVRSEKGQRNNFTNITKITKDPLRSMLSSNWLLPGSMLFRTKRVDGSLFSDVPKYLEWTYIALRLSMHHQIAFVDDPTVIHNVGLPFSTDTSLECQIGRTKSMRRLLELELPRDVRRTIKNKAVHGCHCLAERMRSEGRHYAAWKWHLQSLFSRSGWRYLGYTRKLTSSG